MALDAMIWDGDRDEHRDRDPHRERDRDHNRDRARDRDREHNRDRDRRRRSRSPGGQRNSRREFEGDTYSSSRDYREREREDRYRDRRGEREWDRDRGDRDRREARRDDDRPPARRERDLFDDERRGSRRDRDGFGGAAATQGGRKKSATPPPKKREPTPDLTNVMSILERKRRLTQWDIKPPGYEHVSAESAKMSGMFPLPGAPRQQPVDPSRLQALNQPQGQASTNALKPSSARQSKRLFVYNFLASSTNDSIQEYFNLELNGLNVVSGIDPCLSAQLSKDNSFAMLEFKAPEDATMALALDGTSMEGDDVRASNGASNGDASGLVIKRPKDYIMPAVADDVDMEEGAVSGHVPDTQNKLCISRIPAYLTEDQVQELLVAFGALKSFVLAKYTSTEQSKGIAFCEYVDPSSTEVALEGLNGMELGDQLLKVTRASIGIQQASGLEMGVNAMSMLAGTTSDAPDQGRVLQLLNMTTAEELMKDGEYEGVMEDVEEEAAKYGGVLEIKIPRPVGGREVNGVGKVFIKFADSAAAQKALRALAGRNFSSRTVVATFFGEEYFDINAW
ncbi:MAG: hypothetical protein M1822_005626 [Bathelium mastoideum]|nr:MAG: hypothetical protein M1822_005626 [Bathelium mastoideum]